MKSNATNNTKENTSIKIPSDGGNYSNTSVTITPWNILPTSVTEQVQVIAITDYGCIAESFLEHSVVVENCQAIVGNTISATFYVPAMEQNGYYDKIHEKLTP